MLQIKSTHHKNGTTTFRIQYPLGGVERALKATPPGSLSALVGWDIDEELRAFARENRVSYSEQILGLRPVRAYPRECQSFGLGETPRRRIVSFLARGDASSLLPITFREAAQLDEDEMQDVVIEAYAKSRRTLATKVAADEMRIYLQALQSAINSGPLVAMPSKLTMNDVVAIALWRNQRELHPGVLLFDYEGSAEQFRPDCGVKIHRTYIPEEAFISSASQRTDIPGASIRSAIKVWKATQPPFWISESGFTITQCSNVLRILDATRDPTEAILNEVPAQRVAPLRFKVEAGQLALLATREHHPGDLKLKGGAEACREIADDLMEMNIVANAIPNFGIKVQRIAHTLTQICASDFDDSTIVRLGVQVSALEYRLEAAKDQLGEYTFQEASVFFATLRGFLSQFEEWNVYKASYVLSPDIDEKAIEAATSVVEAVSRSSAATTGATKAQLEKYLSEIEPHDVTKAEATGAVSTAENVIASAASEIAREVRAQGKELTKETVAQIRARSANGIAAWFVDSIPGITKFALATGNLWIRHLIDKIH
jgi:hypothetical protein